MGGGWSIAQCPVAPVWSKMEMETTTLHALFQRRRGARGAGGVPSRSPTRSRAGGQNGGDGSTEGRRDGGTEGILVHDFTPPQSPDSCRPANRAVEVVGASRNRHLARRYFPQRRWRPLPSAGADACLTPSPFRHGGSLGETERAHGGRVATTQCCANHVVVPHLDSLTIPGRRSRCPRVDHTDLCSGHTGNLIPFPARGARCAFACPRLSRVPRPWLTLPPVDRRPASYLCLIWALGALGFLPRPCPRDGQRPRVSLLFPCFQFLRSALLSLFSLHATPHPVFCLFPSAVYNPVHLAVPDCVEYLPGLHPRHRPFQTCRSLMGLLEAPKCYRHPSSLPHLLFDILPQ